MLVNLLRWLKGYVRVRIKGYSTERFINLCSNKDILIWELKQNEKGYSFNITISEYRKLKGIAYKTKTIPYIIKRIGLPFYIYKYRRKKIFFIGIIAFFFLIYIMSLYIWNISISGESLHTKENILEYLKEEKIYSGIQKNKIDCQELESNMRKKYNDIGWISAEIRGTRLLIKIAETNMPVKANEIKENSHIVAAKDGVITSIVTRDGTPLVKKNDVVKKGDILISGIISITGDGEEIIKQNSVVADGDIKMKTYYEYSDSFRLKHIEKKYIGKDKKKFSIILFNKKLFSHKYRKSYSKCDIIKSDYQFKLGENFYFPIIYEDIVYKEYKEYNYKYTKNQAKVIETKKLNRYIKKLVDNDVRILKNNVRVIIDDNNCIATGKIVVEERVLQYRKIHENDFMQIERKKEK